jgi:flavin-dependent dehydrogenase
LAEIIIKINFLDQIDSNADMEKLIDVAIIGDGPAGAAAAIMMAKSGLSVCIIGLPSHNKIMFGETLPPHIKELLIRLGVWKDFLDDGHLASAGNISAWGDSQLTESHFIFHPNSYGWHLDRPRFNRMLLNAAKRNGVYCFYSKIEPIKDLKGHFTIRFKKQNGLILDFNIVTDFIVDATGRSSWFSNRQGIRRIAFDRLCGYVCFLACKIKGDSDSMTLIESVSDGWWYSALLPGNIRVVSFFTDSDLPITEFAKTFTGWNLLMRNTKYIRLNLENYDYYNTSGPHIMLSNSSKIEKVNGENWLSIGDATATYDPLSSNGIVTAINDGIRASNIIFNYLNGSARYLDEYNNDISTNFNKYLEKRAFYYKLENRWADSVFWKRNQAYDS